MTSTVQLRSPADLIASIPYQLGFHPDHCVVVVGMAGRQVCLVQRLDAHPASQQASAEQVAHSAAGVLARESPTGVILVGYDDHASPVRSMLLDHCDTLGIEVYDVLEIRAGSWRSVFGPAGETGQPLPSATDTPAVAEWVALGIAPLADRHEVASLLQPGPDEIIEPVAAQLRRAAARSRRKSSRLLVGAWAQILDPGQVHPPIEQVDAEVVADALSALSTLRLRDALICWLAPGVLPTSAVGRYWPVVHNALGTTPWAVRTGPDGHRTVATPSTSSARGGDDPAELILRTRNRLIATCTRTPRQWQPPLLSVLAAFAWWQGEGALAIIAVERALQIDPAYTLAGLLVRMIDLGIRP